MTTINAFNRIITFTQSASKKEFQKYLIGILAGTAILAFGLSYYIYSSSAALKDQLKGLGKTTDSITRLLAKSKQLNIEEEKIKDILDANPNFKINTYFEEFYTKHKLKPEPGWKPDESEKVIEGAQEGARYQEVTLQATFKDETMEKLVTILQDIEKEPIVYLKGLEITAEKSKINFELTLATKQYKKEVEED